MKIEIKQFYRTTNNKIGYLLSIPNYEQYYIIRLENLEILEFAKDCISCLKELISAEIIIENNIKKIYLPDLDRILDYNLMCKEYIVDGILGTQASPFGYKHQIIFDLCGIHKPTLQNEAEWNSIHNIVNWVTSNFNSIEYEITKYYTYDYDDVYTDGIRQTGISIWFNNLDHVNLTKMIWSDEISKFGTIISKIHINSGDR